MNQKPAYGQPIQTQQNVNPTDQTHSIILNQGQPQIVANYNNINFGTKPISITCQFCQQPVTSKVDESVSIGSVVLCICLCLGFWVCVQCCRNKEINCCDAKHTCPNCGNVLGYYKSC